MASAKPSTGDIKNNLMKLLREMQRMKLQIEPNIQGLTLGAPSAFLPILHAALMHFSLPLADWLSRHDYDLYGKNDLRFIEGMYRVVRDVFNCKPCLTKEQFLSTSFAERKVIFTTEVLQCCQAKHRALLGRRRPGRVRRQKKLLPSPPGDEAKVHSEVLTVHDAPGIGSVWREHTLVEAVVESTHEDMLTPSPSTPPPSPQRHHPHPLLAQAHPLTEDPNPIPNHAPLNTKTHFQTNKPPESSTQQASSAPPPPHHNEVDLSHLQKSVEAIASRLQQLQASHTLAQSEQLVVRHPLSGVGSDTQVPMHERGGDAVGTGTGQERGRQRVTPPVSLEGEGDVVTVGGDGCHGDSPSRAAGGDSPGSWHSLESVPLRGGPESSGAGKTGAEEEQVAAPSLAAVSDRVEQLVRLVEKMSARFVVLETQLKLAEGRQPRGQTGRLAAEKPLPSPSHTPTAVPSRSQGEPLPSPSHTPTAVPSRSQGEPLPSPSHTPTAVPSRSQGEPLPSPSHTPTAVPSRSQGGPPGPGRLAAVKSLQKRTRTEHTTLLRESTTALRQSPTVPSLPPSQLGYRDDHSFSRPQSSHHETRQSSPPLPTHLPPSPPPSSWPLSDYPNTPEDTRRLIDSLRTRRGEQSGYETKATLHVIFPLPE